jgi:hypothetical protein
VPKTAYIPRRFAAHFSHDAPPAAEEKVTIPYPTWNLPIVHEIHMKALCEALDAGKCVCNFIGKRWAILFSSPTTRTA